jgi:hypothetical protein
VIGIESDGDGGQLFMLACIVLLASGSLVVLYRKDLKKIRYIPDFIKRLV